ncbi:hypothetical protein H4Q32_030666 [Labeo rohita]|uniref:Gypsy retrotransposon integrase-like protein 1 n=1 Tax=Labeo rohita TaxID=84645 RepID=A0ABQ8L2Y3_LABRO|nr:hypothetical protein H4Q32_030666 [Labeo rohita]
MHHCTELVSSSRTSFQLAKVYFTHGSLSTYNHLQSNKSHSIHGCGSFAALLLAAYDYDVQYRNGAHHCNTDGLSRLSLPTAHQVKMDTVELLKVKQLDALPVLCAVVCKESRVDPILSQVTEMVATGCFPHVTDANDLLAPYVNRRDELTMQHGCLMWGWRVVIPPKLRPKVLAELYTGHPGVIRMKAVARSYVWWPGPFEGHMYLVVVDAHSKWPEVCVMDSTTSTKTIQVLRTLYEWLGGTFGSDIETSATLSKRINIQLTKAGHFSTGVQKYPTRHHKVISCHVVPTS